MRRKQMICWMLAVLAALTLVGGCADTSALFSEEADSQTVGLAGGYADTAELISEEADMQTSLQEIGTITDQEKKYDIDTGIHTEEDNGKEQFYDYKGRETGKSYANIEKLEDGSVYGIEDCYTIESSKRKINSCGLINRDGEELIPCEASIISALSERYVEVIYATEQTNNKKEAIFYSTSNIVSFKPKEGDTLYKGFMQVYDLKNKRMVPNIKIENAYEVERLKICGASICWTKEDGTSELYNEKGKVILSNRDSQESMYIRNNLIEMDGMIYSDQGKELIGYREGSSPRIVNGNMPYISYSKDRDGKTYYTVTDTDGNIVVEKTERKIHEIYDDMICYSENGSSDNGLMTLEGEVIVSPTEDLYTYCGSGYWKRWKSGSTGATVELISKDGVIASNLENRSSSLICEISGTSNYVVLNGKNKTLELENVDELTDTLAAAERDGYYGVVDMYNGEQLLEYEYDDIRYMAGCIYAYKDGEWTIYQIA